MKKNYQAPKSEKVLLLTGVRILQPDAGSVLQVTVGSPVNGEDGKPIRTE